MAVKGEPAGTGSNKIKAREARFQLPGLLRRLGLMDLDIGPDPERIERLGEIFEQLPDQLVLDLANRIRLDPGVIELEVKQFVDEFGISPAEGRLLESLLSGQSVVEHAKKSNVSVNTARTQMRHLLEKTDSSGQLDLIRKYYGLRE